MNLIKQAVVCFVLTFFVFGGISLYLVSDARARRHSAEKPAEVSPAPRTRSIPEVIEMQRVKCEVPMPKGLIETVISHETQDTWNPKAFNPEVKSKCYRKAKTAAERNRCASRGLMQVVHRWNGKGLEPEDLDNPILNIEVGTDRKLCPCWKQYRTVWGAAYCYNGSGLDAVKYADTITMKFEKRRNG